jgi:hypothetical protein
MRTIGPECVGCNKVNSRMECIVYLDPIGKFRLGRSCPLASHIKTGEQIAAEKKRIGQQKQKKKKH